GAAHLAEVGQVVEAGTGVGPDDEEGHRVAGDLVERAGDLTVGVSTVEEVPAGVDGPQHEARGEVGQDQCGDDRDLEPARGTASLHRGTWRVLGHLRIRRRQPIQGSPVSGRHRRGANYRRIRRSSGGHLATLAHEGTYSILYQSWPIPIGTAHRTGYIARPDAHGRFPVVIVASGLGGLTSFEKDVCRQLARVGIAAVAFDPYASRTGDALADYNLLSDTEALSDLDEV